MIQTLGFRFIICNLVIAGMIGIVTLIQHCARSALSGRIRYLMWKLMLLALIVPFIPVQAAWSGRGYPEALQAFWDFITGFLSGKAGETAGEAVREAAEQTTVLASSANLDDYASLVGNAAPPAANLILMGVWGLGVAAGVLWIVRSYIRMKTLCGTAVPVEDAGFREIFAECLERMEIRREIPVCGTAFLKSPVLAGIIKTRICFPIRLIKNGEPRPIRYMLLHELCHYRRRDNLFNLLMNVFRSVYWFNPAVHLMGRKMVEDREAACDESVLMMLKESEYMLYGYTLLDVAAGTPAAPEPFTAGIGTGIRQMRKRIENIAAYRPVTMKERVKNIFLIVLTAVVLLTGFPSLPVFAGGGEAAVCSLEEIFGDDKVLHIDLSDAMRGYDGSFALYDETEDKWIIYNEENVLTRVSPLSTWKIYDAVLGLESGVITPADTEQSWDGTAYPFDAWEHDQNLNSAMEDSVNWYFQDMDRKVGSINVKAFLKRISYGNETMGEDLTSYWLDSSLKVAPAEQVVLLRKLFRNEFGFKQENIEAVKDTLRLSSRSGATVYGKTGTARADGELVSGWFVGAVEKTDGNCYFAVNIQGTAGASGSRAAKIAGDVLSELGI